MTDKPTALDRLRAGLRRRNEAAADENHPAPQPAEEPCGETLEPPPADAPPDKPEPAPPSVPPCPQPNTEVVELRRLMRVSIDGLKIEHEEKLARTRLRINLRWAMAVMCAITVVAGYLYLSHNQEELFQRHWRAHVWTQHGGSVLACINEARKVDEPVLCRFHVSKYGPDCPPKNQVHGRFIASGAYFRCPPWEPPEGPWSQ